MKKIFCMLSLAVALQGCSKPEDQATQTETTSAPSNQLVKTTDTPTPPAPEPSPMEELVQKQTLAEAVDYLKPQMTDTFNSFPEAAGYLALWWHKNGSKWNDLKDFEDAKFGKVLKDPDTERGKRICTFGSIIEIAADKSAGFTVYHAGIMDRNYKNMRVLAVGSTGEIIAQSTAKFCGIVIGKVGFENAAGGTTEAVYAVGLFDLPENR
jgi:hypothetical protein